MYEPSTIMPEARMLITKNFILEEIVFKGSTTNIVDKGLVHRRRTG